MKPKIIVLIALLVLTFPVLSCVVTSHDYYVDISCDEFTENPTGLQDTFDIEIGDKIYIELCSNPTTGFQWSYNTSGDTAVKEEEHDFDEPEGDMAGAPGKETWTFEGIGRGTAEILMEYSQPWDGGIKGEWTYRITVMVE